MSRAENCQIIDTDGHANKLDDFLVSFVGSSVRSRATGLFRLGFQRVLPMSAWHPTNNDPIIDMTGLKLFNP